MTIRFQKLDVQHLEIIFKWLVEPHILEFWDNTQEHKDDIVDFVNGRREKSGYYGGIFDYWIGCKQNIPYSFLLTSEMLFSENDITDLHRAHLSKTGKTITIDFCIGNKDFLGKGLGANTLVHFVNFYRNQVDASADTFFIDPDENNPRAMHVYSKAGFCAVGDFDVELGVFKENRSYLMIKKI